MFGNLGLRMQVLIRSRSDWATRCIEFGESFSSEGDHAVGRVTSCGRRSRGQRGGGTTRSRFWATQRAAQCGGGESAGLVRYFLHSAKIHVVEIGP